VWVRYTTGDQSQGVHLSDLVVADNATNGIFAFNANDVVIERCLSVNNGQDGMDVSGSGEGTRISQNVCNDNGNYGISVAAGTTGNFATTGTVMDNRLLDNVSYGLFVIGAVNNVVVARNLAGGSGSSDYVLNSITNAAPVEFPSAASPSPFANIRVQ
jgi:hypothetical protein